MTCAAVNPSLATTCGRVFRVRASLRALLRNDRLSVAARHITETALFRLSHAMDYAATENELAAVVAECESVEITVTDTIRN